MIKIIIIIVVIMLYIFTNKSNFEK